MSKNTLLQDATLEQFTESLIKGNGFGFETIWLKSIFNKKFFSSEKTMTPYYHNICQFVMKDFFESKEYKLISETNYDEAGEAAIVYENIQYDLNKYIEGYKNAYLIYEHKKDKDKICISLSKYGEREIYYKIYFTDNSRNTLLTDWIEWARSHNFYKNKKIDVDGAFLELSNVTWDDVIMDQGIIDVIKSNVDENLKYSEILKINKIPLKRGIILCGEPGTGKTLLAKVLAKEIEATVIYVLPSHMERASDISKICEMAKELAPTMIILEDLDYIAQDRNETYNSGNVIQLMNQMDGIQEFSDVITFATTNDIEKIEKAIKNRPGRFDRVIKVPKPDQLCKVKMLKRFTENFIIDKSVDFEKIAKKLGDVSGAHIKDFSITSAFTAIKNGSVNEHKIAVIKDEHFNKAMAEVQNIDYSSYAKSMSQKKLGFSSEFD